MSTLLSPFYTGLNEILDRTKFDCYAERICRQYYAATVGRPSIAPGVYFRCSLIGLQVVSGRHARDQPYVMDRLDFAHDQYADDRDLRTDLGRSSVFRSLLAVRAKL